MYRPIQVKSSMPAREKVSVIPPSGENKRSLPQLLDVNAAIQVTNYIINDAGQLIKRKGLTKLFEVAGTDGINMLEKYNNDTYIFGYGTTVARYTISTGTITNIKTNFSANNGFVGVRYGEYFFVANGVEKIWRMDNTFAISEVANSPICSVLVAIGARLFAGNLSTDSSAVKYSAIDTGTNPPFNDWTVGTASGSAGLVNYRNAGAVRSIVPLGDNIVVLSDEGEFAFYINTIDSGGTISKVDTFQQSRINFGASRGAIATEKGLFKVNEAGLWQVTALGQKDLPYSNQEALVSYNLGNKFFDQIDLSDADLVYDRRNSMIFLTCKKGSDVNNFVIGYHIENKSFVEIKQWTVSRWMNDGEEIYATSAVSNVVWKAFDGDTDDGRIIGTEYTQEITTGNLFTRQMLLGFYIQGFLSASSEVFIHFDIYDVTGRLIKDKHIFQWGAQYSAVDQDGWGIASWGESSWGGDRDTGGTVESFDGCRPYIRNYQRLRVRIVCNDKSSHSINWFSVQSKVKANIRRRKLTQIT